MRLPTAATVLFLVAGTLTLPGVQEIPLPPRPSNALSGSAFAQKVAELDLAARDREISAAILSGNVPDFWRRFVEVNSRAKAGERIDTAGYWVSPDYLGVGSNDDYLLTPMGPGTAQGIADALGCILPTRKMVDDIYGAAAVKLAPAVIPASLLMTTIPVFLQHSAAISAQRASFLNSHPLGTLVAGHKKDVVITGLVKPDSPKVAIYGWHRPGGAAIQPLFTGHTAKWVDYSHGIRFVRKSMTVNGASSTIDDVLADPSLAHLLSDEGVIKSPRYPILRREQIVAAERTDVLHFEPGVRVIINSPGGTAFDPTKPTKLILYALPNGNTIEQTAGRRVSAGEDWHFDIQHIAAQIRWLRANVQDANLVIAYLECAEKAWPAWRRKNDPESRRIPDIVASLMRRFEWANPSVVLTGHSGGGSFTFGYLNGVDGIPEFVERIAFLDSNYGYDAAQGHDAKLAEWLARDPKRYLAVIAYHDDIALLEGKPFVSATGGTWGRSQAMLRDLSKHFALEASDRADVQRRFALNGHLQFLLRENPTRAIFHTRMVELNGFIHAMLTGTELEEQGYKYLGPRVYSEWIAAE